uniref:Phosphatidylinositol-glycan biosynthesis class W protein n=1 Tax=Glossina brevipalpis TaxID=37001 RepID=A0A1A9VZW8_9MUSC
MDVIDNINNSSFLWPDKAKVSMEGRTNIYCNAYESERHCLSISAQLLACNQEATSGGRCYKVDTEMSFDDVPKRTVVIKICHIFCTVVVTLIAAAMSRIITQKMSSMLRCKHWLRFLMEFILITLHSVFSVNVANAYVEYVCCVMFIIFGLIAWWKKCDQRARDREFHFGHRPQVFTLLRATISYLTVLCILAIDFENFPKFFRKTYRYGVSLMDTGIGLFVFSMGIVSQNFQKCTDLKRLLFSVSCMLTLGFARTTILAFINYRQDEREYGVHWNAFFTLGFTKLIGTLLTAVAKSDGQLFLLGMLVLSTHEIALQSGLRLFVMDSNLPRDTFATANREGLCSLPGFVALYILSVYFGKQFRTKETATFSNLKKKLKLLIFGTCVNSILVILSIMTTGIARVTCNIGYVLWILNIASGMSLLYIIVFDIALDTIWPMPSAKQSDRNDYCTSSSHMHPEVPLVMEAINYNGLTFFLLANILTGAVNIYLKPEERNDAESVLILMVYMFLTTTAMFILYKLKLRIA